MTVHNIQIYVAQTYQNGDPVDYEGDKSTVQNWINNHEERLGTQRSEFSEGNTAEDGSGVPYYSGSWRFDFTHNREALLNPLTGILTDRYEWAVVRWHECDHDEGDRGGCEWNAKWEFDMVPEEVREMLNLDDIPEGP